MTKAQKTQIIKRKFLMHYGDAKTELQYSNLYELLVAVMLSAQCTDKRVNLITPALFEAFPSIHLLAQANLSDVKALIKSCSFFNNKATHLIAMAQKVVQEFQGIIPSTQQELKSLPGVGQKTANVVLIEYFGANFMAVDTHVFRVSHRLGLTQAKTAQKTEEELVKLFQDNLHALHQGFVLFGRYICKAVTPNCKDCFVSDLCKTKKNFKPQ
ncbi:endonuclease III [Helicobacter pametensis]|uniref:endonuclease III n=1 Tax=Helicobacter pametensis TaxID=95149 RepID=UPI0004850477|nr:endonuclease III [Helicobacter pametensis]